jgi:hypothetical protein
MIANECAAVSNGTSPIETWQKKLTHLRSFFEGMGEKFEWEKKRKSGC